MTFAAIVLAAGSATRFGGGKMSASFRGERLVSHAIKAARAAPVSRVIVVTHPDLEIGDWDGSPSVETVLIASDALSTSLKAGLSASGEPDGVFVFLGDMPLVPPSLAQRLAALLPGRFAAVPRHDGTPGHPVLLSRAAFAEIAVLEDDAGAGRLLQGRNDVAFLDIDDPSILLDIDRREDLARLDAQGN